MSAQPISVPLTGGGFDAALSRLCLAMVRSAAGRRARSETAPIMLTLALRSSAFHLALVQDERTGLSLDDAAQVLVGIGAWCPRHLRPFDGGDDVTGLLCISCEDVPSSWLQRVDCDPCGGSCEGRCDAGSGTFPEIREAERSGVSVSDQRAFR